MDEVLIENWNKVVKPGDIVYHLGDVTVGRYDNLSQEEILRCSFFLISGER